jgi:hypothetical protein
MKPEDRRRRPASDATPDAQRRARLQAALRLRGIAKVVLVTLGMGQLLTLAFTYCANLADSSIGDGVALLFNFLSCALVSYWLQADARRAYHDAKTADRLGAPSSGDAVPMVDAACPNRWLVVLHLELNPHLLDA